MEIRTKKGRFKSLRLAMNKQEEGQAAAANRFGKAKPTDPTFVPLSLSISLFLADRNY